MSCDAFRDSRKTATTAILTLEFQSVESASLSSGDTTVITIAPVTLSRTWTRAAYSPRQDHDGYPPADEFWMLSKCCCWKCRFAAITSDDGGAIESFLSDASFVLPFSSVFTPAVGPPVTTSGSYATDAMAATNFTESAGVFCRASDESGRTGQLITLGSVGKAAAFIADIDYSYTDSDGRTDSGVVTNGLMELGAFDLPINSCSESPSAWAQVVYTGSETLGGDTYTADATIKVTLEFS